MAGKREEVRGVTPLDIKKINDNFKNLWQSVFGNINFTDVNQEFKNKISALSNKILTVSNSLKIHTSDSLIHVSDTEKAKWDNKENKGHRHSFNDIDKVVASVLLSNKVSPLNGGVGCLNMGGVIFIYVSIKNENALSSGLNS